ncbi:MAG TPA: AraC family transcriptional regulator [Saprospiraceae bacterium]|nr:AraC family transcriptional regulator [Saprospiraceae bacterium]
MKVFKENTPLKENDVFVILDSCNNGFDYPIHNHPEIEINLILGTSGHRVVGDSSEAFIGSDLVILGPYLHHKWYGDEEDINPNVNYRVITIQFDPSQFNMKFLTKDSFGGVVSMFNESLKGIQFYGETFNKAAQLMLEMTETTGFENVILFLRLLDILSKSNESRFLSSVAFMNNQSLPTDHRIQIAFNHIFAHYTDPNFKMSQVSLELKLSESAFSHFFFKYAHRSYSDFLIDLRLGHACKLLISTDKTIGEISFSSGFNNLANFNRLFKKYRNATPISFRKKYFMEAEHFKWDEQRTPWQFVPDKNNNGEVVKPNVYSTKILHV